MVVQYNMVIKPASSRPALWGLPVGPRKVCVTGPSRMEMRTLGPIQPRLRALQSGYRHACIREQMHAATRDRKFHRFVEDKVERSMAQQCCDSTASFGLSMTVKSSQRL